MEIQVSSIKYPKRIKHRLIIFAILARHPPALV
jgi:hypothetical protein